MSSFLFIDKPAGIATHATERPAPGIPEGIVEYASRLAERRLFVCHRLDRETTGALVFATNAEAAARLAEAFESRAVEKTYLFVTDHVLTDPALTDPEYRRQNEFRRESLISKKGNRFVSEASPNPNAATSFRLLRCEGRFSLWEARPETGKPHQIRLHAADAGLPILGDDAHGGSPFPALCLHSATISFSDEAHESSGDSGRITHTTPPPIYFENLALLSRSRLSSWLAAFDRRHRWLHLRAAALGISNKEHGANETWRWVHTEGGPLRVEQLGSLVSLQWFGEQEPSPADWDDIHTLLKIESIADWRLHLRLDRGRNPNQEDVWASREDLPTRWVARENGLSYELRADSGLSAGLFLDQRANRLWTREQSRDRHVLNLFCYTGGFSVCAAAGGATQVVSVDLSRTFLEWVKTNFELNGLTTEGHEFRAMDAREYLKFARKKERRFDLIICDPPSFGRSDKGVFRIEKDLPELIEGMAAILAPKGRLLFSCNYEKWDDEDFKHELQRIIRERRLPLKTSPPPAPDWDYELPRPKPDQSRVMKNILLERI